MQKQIASFLVLTLLLLILNCTSNIGQSTDIIQLKSSISPKMGVDGKLQLEMPVFNKHLVAIKKYALANSCSAQYAFLVDMSIHSGAKRFFVVDMKTGKILTSGLVTHGSSTIQLKDGERKYSNENSSYCTSLGKYKIGEKYYGKFGLAYKLAGLDVTNNHAYARAVVLHSHPYVPDAERETAICQSWGCPTVSPNFLKILSIYIADSQKPILLDIYDSEK